jgi:Tfp pilus assembly protein PilF
MRDISTCLLALLLTGCAAGRPAINTRPAAAGPDGAGAAALPRTESMPAEEARRLRPRLNPAPTLSPGTTTAEQASRELRTAVALHASAPTVANRVALGQAYLAAGINDLAHDHFLAAVRTDPRQGLAWEGMARIWRDWGYPGIALGDAYRAVSASPDSAAAHNTLGTILQTVGKGHAARARFSRSAALDPGAAYAHNNVCYSLLMEGDAAGAAAACARAIAVDPSLVPAQHNMALVLASRGDASGAADVFRTTGDEASAQYNIGIVYLSQRRFVEAAEAFENAAGMASAPPLALARANQARQQAAAPPEDGRTSHGRR